MRTRTALASGLIVLAIGGLVAARSVSHLGSDILIGGSSDRAHLHAIAVPASACVPLGQVRVTARAAGDGWWSQLGSDGPSWRDFARRLEPKLDRFATALYAALPNVPPPIATRLQKVLTEVTIGRHHLRRSTSAVEYVADTNLAVVKGERALIEASDLTGKACGPPLYVATTLHIST